MLSRRSLYFLQRQCSRMYSNGAISLLAMLVPISVAHIAYADSTTPGSHSNLLCDQLYPCAHCVRRKVACSWPTIEPNRIQHFLGPMRLSFGAAGSARLDAKYDKSGNNVQMEWQGAVEEREGETGFGLRRTGRLTGCNDRSSTRAAFQVSSIDDLSAERCFGWRARDFRSTIESAGQSNRWRTTGPSSTSTAYYMAYD